MTSSEAVQLYCSGRVYRAALELTVRHGIAVCPTGHNNRLSNEVRDRLAVWVVVVEVEQACASARRLAASEDGAIIRQKVYSCTRFMDVGR